MATTSAANAGVLRISQDPEIVTAIERFGVPKDRQDGAVEDARRHISTVWRANPDFLGAVLLKSRLSGNVSVYAQWRRPQEGRAPTAPPAAQSLAQVMNGYAVQLSKTFSVEFSAFSPTVAGPTLVSVERTPAAHFGIFPLASDRQNEVVDLARAFGPTSLATPGLLSINFHRSLDGGHVLNFGHWSFLETDFNKLTQQPGFRKEDRYWADVVDAEPDFFDIAAVETRASPRAVQPFTRERTA